MSYPISKMSFCDFNATCYFILGAQCEGSGVCAPLPANLEELKQIITTALQTVTKDMLQRVWTELEYRYDVCCVSDVFGRSWSTDMTCAVSQTCLGGAGVPI